jgi:ferredoxin-type protein NapG
MERHDMARKSKTAYDDDSGVDRRDFFGQLLREIARPVAEFREAVKDPPAESGPPEPLEKRLRPPGALHETLFTDVCDRSGECVEACPANAILSGADGTPYVDPHHQPCVVCVGLDCMSACASGALMPRAADALGMGLARVDSTACLRSTGEDCTRCIQVCPLHELGHTVLDLTLDGSLHVYEDACVGCGCCVRACPTQPKAINVEPARLLA